MATEQLEHAEPKSATDGLDIGDNDGNTVNKEAWLDEEKGSGNSEGPKQNRKRAHLNDDNGHDDAGNKRAPLRRSARLQIMQRRNLCESSEEDNPQESEHGNGSSGKAKPERNLCESSEEDNPQESEHGNGSSVKAKPERTSSSSSCSSSSSSSSWDGSYVSIKILEEEDETDPRKRARQKRKQARQLKRLHEQEAYEAVAIQDRSMPDWIFGRQVSPNMDQDPNPDEDIDSKEAPPS